MPATKYGVYHNLKESEYAISNGEIAFFFSSEFYQNKFLDGYRDNRRKFTTKIKTQMNHHPIYLNMNILADITLYKTIEKRGFLAMVKGVEVNWQNLQKYALRQMTVKNTPNWSKTRNPRLTERLKAWADM